MQLTQKIRIEPSKEQEEVLWELSEVCRLLYNFSLAERINAWKSNKPYVNYTQQQNKLPELKKKFERYTYVYSKVLQMVLRKLDENYKSFFTLWKKRVKDANPPKFRSKKYFMTMLYNQSGFKINKGKIRLSHNYSDLPLEFDIPEKFEFGRAYQISISFYDDDFWLSIVYGKNEKPYIDNGIYQAIDLGVTNIVTAVNSKGKFLQIKNQRVEKYWKKPIAELQSRRDGCIRKSKRWQKVNKLLKKCERKEANQSRDFQHKLSRKMIDNTKANTIIVGKLETKKLAQQNKYAKTLNKSLQNTGISRFVGFLTYKAILKGKRIIEINERGTTRTCHACGKENKMFLYKRFMKCDCGNEMDRDKNSAINIMVRYLSQNAFVNRLSDFEGNLRKTGIIHNRVLHSQEAITSTC